MGTQQTGLTASFRVWCGGVGCGVVFCGVLWCFVVWCGVAWRGVAWRGVAWRGVVWCGVVWCGVVWCGVVWWYTHIDVFTFFSFTKPVLGRASGFLIEAHCMAHAVLRSCSTKAMVGAMPHVLPCFDGGVLRHIFGLVPAGQGCGAGHCADGHQEYL